MKKERETRLYVEINALELFMNTEAKESFVLFRIIQSEKYLDPHIPKQKKAWRFSQ
jgi:hypothetical protein